MNKLRFDVEYPWAVFNKTQTLIHIKEAQKSTDHSFTCPDCDSEFVACQGNTNKWYFKHKNSQSELECVSRHNSQDMINYFERYPLFNSIAIKFTEKYPQYSSYKKIGQSIYCLVDEQRKLIIEFVDFRGIQALDKRINNATMCGYDIMLVTAYHKPVKKKIESSRKLFETFEVVEFQTQLFPELFTSMKEHAGVITIDDALNITAWKQSNNPKYYSQVIQSDNATNMVLNYLGV